MAGPVKPREVKARTQPASAGDDVRGLLQAGAILPTSTSRAAAGDEPLDTIEARRYSHPALGDRPVVRLVPSSLAPAEDLTLEFLGFGPVQAVAPVGLTRRRSLGFPGWALVHDPANAGFALAVVKEMERLARVARSKPGNAQDGFDEIARRLARSVPRFLPSFYEQAGRAFLESGNHAMASSMFSKARAAELAHSLTVDESQRRAAFLEFAFAGALSAKALDEYGRTLADAYPPPDAFGYFRELAVQRTLGGLPPWTGMTDGLHRLAKAAGLDPAAEDGRLVVELLDAPAIALAPLGFWKPLRPVLLALGRSSDEVRGKLLNLFPKPLRGGGELHGWWLKLLADAGATDALVAAAGTAPAAAEPAGGPAAWMSRLVTHLSWGRRAASWGSVLELFEAMAGRLRADGVPVTILGGRPYEHSADLIDLALALGVPFTPPPPHFTVDLGGWLGHPADQRRTLEHLASDETFGPALDRGLSAYLSRERAAPLVSIPGLRPALLRWLDERATWLSRGGLQTVRTELELLTRAAPPEVVALNPSAAERIAHVDVAAALARTLRAGVVDELGWPALESVEAKLAAKDVAQHPAWPFLVLIDAARAVVVGPSEVDLEHDLRLPAGPRYRVEATVADGQLLVAWADRAGTHGYWSGDPSRPFDMAGYWSSRWPSLEVPGGGRTFGGRALRAGDTAVETGARPATDGTDWWQLVQRSDFTLQWREFDPVRGVAGRASLPPFFVDGEEEGWRLQHESCRLAGADGLRVRMADDGRVDCTTPAGSHFRGRLGPVVRQWPDRLVARAPEALIRLPGDARPRPVVIAHSHGRNGIQLLDPTGSFAVAEVPFDGRRPVFARGMPFVPPPAYWSALRPRDPTGSAALRTLSDESARRLLAAARKESAHARSSVALDAMGAEELPATRAVLRAEAPGVTDPALVAGVLGVVQAAAWLDQRIAAAAAVPVAEVAVAAPAPDPSDLELADALHGLVPTHYWLGRPSSGQTLQQLRVVSTWLAGEEESGPEAAAGGLRRLRDRLSRSSARRPVGAPPPARVSLPPATVAWWTLPGLIEGVVYRAAVELTPASQRATLARLLEVWASTPLAGADARRMRRLVVTAEDRESLQVPFVAHGGSRYFVGGAEHFRMVQPAPATVLEGATEGRFRPPPSWVVVSEEPIAGRCQAGELSAFVELLRERGPLPWRPERVDLLVAATGMTRAEAALLLAGLPNIDQYAQNFLPKALREALGLKVAEAAAARTALSRIDVSTRSRLLGAAVPDRPTELWDERAGSLVDRMAAAWVRAFGRRAVVPEELVAAAAPFTGRTPLTAQQLLGAVADPASVPALQADATWFIDADGDLAALTSDISAEFSATWVRSLVPLLAWLAASLPVGDAIGDRVPEVLDLLRARLSNPELLFAWHGLGLEQAEVLGVRRLDPYRAPRGKPSAAAFDAGAVVFAPNRWQGITIFLRPSALAGEQPVPWVDASLGVMGSSAAPLPGAVRFVFGPDAAAIVARIRTSPVPRGRYEADPRASAPDLVAEVADVRGVSGAAACYYLQVLALHDPTNKSVAAWNGWTPAEIKQAAAELVTAGLVVAGKRPRAGRDAFLPGGWENRSAPDLPLESWKLPLYGISRGADGRLVLPLGQVLPLRPRHELFTEAWRRCQAGDPPGLEAAGPAAGERRRR